LTANSAVAQDWFEIEVIIFEHKNVQDNPLYDSEDAEHWPRDLDLTWPFPLLELESAVKRIEPVEILPPFEELVFDQRRMNNDSYALRVREPYELLWHKAWRAPLLPEGQAPWILVQASDELGNHHRLEGAIRIHLSRYLHLSTNLWLTEVSGEPVIEGVNTEDALTDNTRDSANNLPVDSINEALEPTLNSVLEEVEVRSEFDWSQLPELDSVRWGCNYVRELWPEDNRLLPADYYDNPAPADWYYPFGCRTPSEHIERDIPYFVNIPTSDRYPEAELELYYPELFIKQTPLETDLPLLGNNDFEGEESASSTAFSIDHSALDTRALLDNIEVAFFNEDGSYEGAEAELIPPAPKVHYLVKEIIHIKGKRRMRSGEFHYIDHPKIGILALIHPVEKPELVLEQTAEETVPESESSFQ